MNAYKKLLRKGLRITIPCIAICNMHSNLQGEFPFESFKQIVSLEEEGNVTITCKSPLTFKDNQTCTITLDVKNDMKVALTGFQSLLKFELTDGNSGEITLQQRNADIPAQSNKEFTCECKYEITDNTGSGESQKNKLEITEDGKKFFIQKNSIQQNNPLLRPRQIKKIQIIEKHTILPAPSPPPTNGGNSYTTWFLDNKAKIFGPGIVIISISLLLYWTFGKNNHRARLSKRKFFSQKNHERTPAFHRR